MACPSGIENTVMVLTPPDPVTTCVRHMIYKGTQLLLVIDAPPNAVHDFGFHFIGQGWIIETRAKAGEEFSLVKDTEEFDGCDPGDFPFAPTNQDIPGPETSLTYET